MNQHIQNIAISNFKSIKDLKINGCKKINIFAGKPNAGKSNILEALALFNKLFVPSEVDIKSIIRFGDYHQLSYEGNTNDGIKLGVNKHEIIFYTKKYEINQMYSVIPVKVDHFNDFYYKTNAFDQSENELSNLLYYKFNINVNIDSSNKIINSNLSVPYGENIAQIISTNKNLREFVNSFFKISDLKLLIEKNTNALKIFKEYEDGTVFTLPYNMIADTLQRLIFYKAAIMSNNDSVLLFEEPEAHCFEPYILEFTNEIKYNADNNQFFMVTHSDFIIQEFLRDEDSKNDLQIYLVNNVDGKTEVKKLDRNNNDDVYEYGMNVFFNFDSLWENN